MASSLESEETFTCQDSREAGRHGVPSHFIIGCKQILVMNGEPKLGDIEFVRELRQPSLTALA